MKERYEVFRKYWDVSNWFERTFMIASIPIVIPFVAITLPMIIVGLLAISTFKWFDILTGKDK
jgi:hypothetical protein